MGCEVPRGRNPGGQQPGPSPRPGSREPGAAHSLAAHSPIRVRIVAPAQQVELAEVQVSAVRLAELATADPSCGGGHHEPGDPGPAAGLQHHEAAGPRRLQHLEELRFGERDLVEQRVQGHAAPVGAQDFGDEAAHLRVCHGGALRWTGRGARLGSGRNRNLRSPGAGAGGARAGRGVRERALSRRR